MNHLIIAGHEYTSNSEIIVNSITELLNKLPHKAEVMS